MEFTIEALCISDKKGVQKHFVEKVNLVENFGIESDAHAGNWHRQVSLLPGEAIDRMQNKHLQLEAGAFGENIITRGMNWSETEVGGRIHIGESELEITQIGKECHNPCSIFEAVGYCIMPKLGIFTKVVKGGMIHAGDHGHYHFR